MKEIVLKYLNGEASETETQVIKHWLTKPKNKKTFAQYVKIHALLNQNKAEVNTKVAYNKILQTLSHTTKPQDKPLTKVRKLAPWIKHVAAASVALMALLYINKEHLGFEKLNTNASDNVVLKKRIEPGSNKAFLELSDGSEVTLEKGKAYTNANAKSSGENLVYEGTSKPETEAFAYNYLTIPRGGQFFIMLSDSTKVWLNSETRIKYPVQFAKNRPREVELIYGEAYFDVSPALSNGKNTFKVKTGDQEVIVYGTEFNIKAYSNDDAIFTTLAEGKVALSNRGKTTSLNPGEQSLLDKQEPTLLVKQVDVYDEVSWKDGLFSFKQKSLKEITKVLTRWYDVEFVFANKELENLKFVGVLNRNKPLQDILITIQNIDFIKAYEIKDHQIILK